MAHKELEYVECALFRGGVALVAWVPEELAIPGEEIELARTEPRRNGWLVLSAGARKPASEISRLRRIDRRSK